MSTGKKSALLAVLALLAAIGVSYSKANEYEYPDGLLTSMLLGLDTPTRSTTNIPDVNKTVYVRSDSTFSLHEENIRRGLIIISVITALLPLILAAKAARKEDHSLWYSSAILIASGAMLLLSLLFGALVLLLASGYILYVRRGKMTLN